MLITIPILSFLVFNQFDFNLEWVPLDWKNTILIVAPWFFSLGWIFVLLLFADRIAGSFDEVDLSAQVIPQRLKIYYGFNAIVVLIIFAFPLLSPVMCILSFASLGFRLSTFRIDWDEEEKTPTYAKIISILFAVYPAIISLIVLPEMFSFSQFIWNTYWLNWVDLLYVFAIALCTAQTYGSLIILVKTGASEYENSNNLNSEDVNVTWVYILEVLLFFFFIFLDLRDITIIQLFYIGGFIIACFITLVNFIKNRKELNINQYLFGYILTVILLGLNMLSQNEVAGEAVKNLSIILSAAMYIGVYFIVFYRYNEN